MTTLTITPDNAPGNVLLHTGDFDVIQRELAAIGIPMQRWSATEKLAPDADQATVLKAYEKSVAVLSAKYDIQSVDVVAMHPAHEMASAARGKFLAEHTHDDFEIRFFVDGAGVFYIRKNGMVYQTLCTAGDLIELPADTTHWFDMGPKPFFKAIRLFTKPDGWVGKFTGDEIAKSFPEYAGAGA